VVLPSQVRSRDSFATRDELQVGTSTYVIQSLARLWIT